MENKRNKAAISVALISGLVLGGGVAFAASGTINTSQLGSGSASVSTCDSAWDLGFGTPVYDSGTATYRVSTVDFSNVAAGCSGQTLAVTVVDGSNNSLADGTVTLAGTSGTVTLSTSVDAGATTSLVSAIYQ
ncbi:MAG: hypothetical protein ACO3VQ_07290 [Ilumatobacteraceae bacterium]